MKRIALEGAQLACAAAEQSSAHGTHLLVTDGVVRYVQTQSACVIQRHDNRPALTSCCSVLLLTAELGYARIQMEMPSARSQITADI